MLAIHKKIVKDENGKNVEVILPYKEYLEIEELLGLDLTDKEKESLVSARDARKKGNTQDFMNIDDINV